MCSGVAFLYYLTMISFLYINNKKCYYITHVKAFEKDILWEVWYERKDSAVDELDSL